MTSDQAYKVIELIGRTKSRNAKIELIKEASEFEPIKKVLSYAYNPFIRFYMQKVSWSGAGVKMFDEQTFKILDMLSQRVLSGNDAKTVVGVTMRDMTPDSAELFKRILKKDLRCGITAKSINTAIPGLIPEHNVMLAEEMDFDKVQYPCWVSPKLDGVRATCINGEFYSRSGKSFTGLEHLRSGLHNTAPCDGELMIPHMSFEASSGKIRNKKPTPEAHFYVFDLAMPDVPFEERMDLLPCYVLDMTNVQVHRIKHVKCHSEAELMQMYDYHKFQGFEGTMVKQAGHFYVGKRSSSWMKMKPQLDVDLEVLSIAEGEGKHQGSLGYVVCMYKGKEVRIGGGFSDEQRASFWEDPGSILHHVIEVQYMEETKYGSLRHPRFKRLRFDK